MEGEGSAGPRSVAERVDLGGEGSAGPRAVAERVDWAARGRLARVVWCFSHAGASAAATPFALRLLFALRAFWVGYLYVFYKKMKTRIFFSR